MSKTIDQKTLVFRGVKLWNKIDDKMKNITFNLFKK